MAKFQSTYNPETALAICERIAEGETLSAICKPGSGLPSRQTFHRWVVQFPELSRAYSAARELSAHSLEEEALDTARVLKTQKGRLGAAGIRALDVAMNQLRWSAARRNPRVYSERAATTVTVPIQINTSLGLGGGTVDNVYQLRAEVIDQPEPEQVDHTAEMKREAPALMPPPTRREQMDAAREKYGDPWKQHKDPRTVAKQKAQEEAEGQEDGRARGADSPL